jgi:hypothetical protein
MIGALGTGRGSLLYFAAWGLLGMLLAALLVAASDAPWGASLLLAVPLALVYGCASGFSSYYLCRAYPLASRPLRAVLGVFGCSAVCASALWTAVASMYSALLRDLVPGLPDMTRPLVAFLFGLGVLLYGLGAVGHYLVLEFERARHLERRELEMKLAAQEAQLRMLRTQIDPHFLFNSLNSISALTSIDAAAARSMTLQLSDFLRRSLGMDAQRKVALDEEIALVRAFLAIEQVRFGTRLRFEDAIGSGAGACLLPPMLLQPLVENAVKHGIGRRLDGGAVRITAELAGALLRIRVENDADEDDFDGAAMPQAGAPLAGCGIGLANVRQRLLATYGQGASVHWTRLAAQFRVELALPAETLS